MAHKITTVEPGTVEVHVTASDTDRPKLLEGFRQCRAGRCGCPAADHGDIESIDVKSDESGVHVRLRARSGTEIDEREIEKCLVWAEGQADR